MNRRTSESVGYGSGRCWRAGSIGPRHRAARSAPGRCGQGPASGWFTTGAGAARSRRMVRIVLSRSAWASSRGTCPRLSLLGAWPGRTARPRRPRRWPRTTARAGPPPRPSHASTAGRRSSTARTKPPPPDSAQRKARPDRRGGGSNWWVAMVGKADAPRGSTLEGASVVGCAVIARSPALTSLPVHRPPPREQSLGRL